MYDQQRRSNLVLNCRSHISVDIYTLINMYGKRGVLMPISFLPKIMEKIERDQYVGVDKIRLMLI